MKEFASIKQTAEHKPANFFAGNRIEESKPVYAAASFSIPIQRKAYCACGGGCPSCTKKHSGRSNDLKVSQPNDAAEIEADRMVDTVMRMPVSDDIRKNQGSATVAPMVQTKGSSSDISGGTSVSGETGSRIHSSRGGGSSLDYKTRGFMESRFGTDLSNVRIHTGSEAASLNRDLSARAFTVGSDIYFNQGQYQPETERGKRLLAHELTHVLQQGNSKVENNVQRYSDTDHHIVEEIGLSSIFPEEELKSIKRGNMQRDYSQLPGVANALLLGNSSRFGGYKPVEHFDNFIFDNEKNRWVSHAEYEKFWDDGTRQWVKKTVPALNKTTSPRTTPLQYIESKLQAALEKDMPDANSFINMGNAFHTIEDFFAHSNFVELTKGDYSSGKELSTHASGVHGPSSEDSILSNVSDPASASYFSNRFASEYEKGSPLSHGRLAKDFHMNPNHSLAITLAVLVVRQIGTMLKNASLIQPKEKRKEYIQNVIMNTLSRYFRPPDDKDKWWENLLAEDNGNTARRIKELQDKTPTTVNQDSGGLLRNVEATRFSSWKAIGLGTSFSVPLKDNTFFTAGYMLYLPGTGSTLNDRIFVAPRSHWDQSDTPKIIMGAQISGTFDVSNLFKKGK